MKIKYFLRFVLLFILLLWRVCERELFSQTKNIDSLLTLIKTDKPDTGRVNHLYQLTREYRLIGDYEKGLIFGAEGMELAVKLDFKKGVANANSNLGNIYFTQADYLHALDFYLKALNLFEELKNKIGVGNCLINIATVYSYQGDSPRALDYYFKALKIDVELKDKKKIASQLGTIGLTYWRQGRYPQALDYYFKALKISEELEDKIIQTDILNYIGIVYTSQGDYSKALNYYLIALKISEELGDKNKTATILGNIGLVYYNQKDYSKALNYDFKVLNMEEALDNKNLIAVSIGNIGNVYDCKEDYPQALNFYFKALEMAKDLKDKNGIAIHLGNIGSLYTKTGKFKEAEKYLKRTEAAYDSIGELDGLRHTEESLSILYDTIGLPKQALVYYKKAIELKDSIFSQENKKELIRKELNYEFDKKETAAKAEQDKKDAITASESKKQQIIIWSIAFGFLFVLLFAGFVFRSLRITRKQKNIIMLQKNEVFKQKDIAEQLRDIAEKQKELVEEKQKEVVASITYAKRIQTALLTSDEYIKRYLPAEYFILFKPKDIVSGDFYWALSIASLEGLDMGTNMVRLLPDGVRKNMFYIMTADCTGHGVPGAFMSMLNISYLNENVIERGIRLPHDILNSQRKEIIQALNPVGSTEESKDGMDCTLCVYDFDKMLLHFAAANNPLWLVRNEELIEYKADKMPVGKYSEKMEPFTLQTIALQKGDIIYTSTDGFADQFGVNGKKLMKKKFKEELLKIHQLPMNEQKEYLNHFFETWKGSNEQVDDVCVIGVRI